jgi:hypothetical protein
MDPALRRDACLYGPAAGARQLHDVGAMGHRIAAVADDRDAALDRRRRPQPAMPNAWSCTALLHPFSPPINPQLDLPFFQLCVADIVCMQGQFFSAQIAGCISGSWWFMVTPSGTQLSTDQGNTWNDVDVGWSLPSNWFGAQAANAACAGTAPLNWLATQNVDWWKVPVPLKKSPPAATWMWFDSNSQAPVRMMFGQGPTKPTLGDPTQLALFQMFSFSYFPLFSALQSVTQPTAWTQPTFPGFAVGNPNGYNKFVWNSNFGMTAFMTPVNEEFNPLPTRVLYVWKPDAEYSVASDRAQDTLMQYTYNDTDTAAQEALLFGEAPQGVTPPPGSDIGYLITYYRSALAPTCIGGSVFPFPQEPPNWVSIPAVEGTIQATITDNPVLCPGTTVTIFSVLFPPALPNYPDATYLWTWYAPQSPDGRQSRPVTFMQSQSGVGVGTSLALADYYFYEEFSQPIDPLNFNVPPACANQGGGQKAKALKKGLPNA